MNADGEKRNQSYPAYRYAISSIRSSYLFVLAAALAGAIGGWSFAGRYAPEFEASGYLNVGRVFRVHRNAAPQEVAVIAPAVLAGQINAGEQFFGGTAEGLTERPDGRLLKFSARVPPRTTDYVEIRASAPSDKDAKAGIEDFAERIKRAHWKAQEATLNLLEEHYEELSEELRVLRKARGECDRRLPALWKDPGGQEGLKYLALVSFCKQTGDSIRQLTGDRLNYAGAIDIVRMRPTHLVWSSVKVAPSRMRKAAISAAAAGIFALLTAAGLALVGYFSGRPKRARN